MSWRYKGGFIQEFFDPLTVGPAADPFLFAWGSGGSGRLGLNSTQSYSSPVQVGTNSNWSDVFSGNGIGGAITSAGTIFTFGRNVYGQLGDGTTVNRSSPVQIGSLTTWTAINGSNTCIAIKNDGTLWGWGLNQYDVLSIGAPDARSSPVQIGSATTWSSASWNKNYIIGIQTDGTLWAWGYNNLGQLGQGNKNNLTTPTKIGALTTWLSISTGNGYFSGAIKTDGTLWTWGWNNTGQLGQNDTISRSSPVQVGALTTWVSIKSGEAFSVAKKSDGTIWSWGANGSGQLGQNNITNYSSPVQIGTSTNWSSLGTGWGGSDGFSAITTNGTLWRCGNSSSGQIGDGFAENRSSPVQIGSNTNWQKASVGTDTTIAIMKT